MGLDRHVERHDQAALEVHLVDHVADLFEHLLVGHHHLLPVCPADFEEPERCRPALRDGLLRAAIVPQKLDGLERRQDQGVTARRERWGIPLEVQSLLDRQLQTVACGRAVFGELLHLDELALGILHLDRDRVHARDFLDVLAVLGVSFEPDRVALDEQLEDHVLHELGNIEPVGKIVRLLLHGVIVAGDLDLVAHRERAPGVDAVLDQRLLDIVLPGFLRPVFPGLRDRALVGMELRKGRRVQHSRSSQRRDDDALRFVRGGVDNASRSVCSSPWTGLSTLALHADLDPYGVGARTRRCGREMHALTDYLPGPATNCRLRRVLPLRCRQYCRVCCSFTLRALRPRHHSPLKILVFTESYK